MKLPLPVFIIAIGIFIGALLIAFRPQTNSSLVASSYRPAYNPEAQITINDRAIDSFSEGQKQPLSWLPAADIRPNYVYAISYNNKQTSLVLVDGSVKKLTDIDIANLSEQLKLKVTYEASK